MWPKLLDIPKEQCVGLLRNLECQAYTVLLDAYRAGGALTDEKRASLEAVAKLLNISTERHKAEVRRAVNDELLNTISTRLCGEDPDYSWAREGRRIIPVLPRGLATTGLSSVAQRAAEETARRNKTLVRPSLTRTPAPPPPLARPEHLLTPAPPPAPVAPHPAPAPHQNGVADRQAPTPRPSDLLSCDTGVVVLPSGAAVKVSANPSSGSGARSGGRGSVKRRRSSQSAAKNIEVFPGGLAQLEAAAQAAEAALVADRSPPRKIAAPGSVLGAGHGYARPLPSNSPLPDRQVVMPLEAGAPKRGPGRPPGPASPQLASGLTSAGFPPTAATRGRGGGRTRGSRPRGGAGVVITPRLATPPHPAPPPQPLLPHSPAVTSARLALRPTVSVSGVSAAPRATTIQLKQESAGSGAQLQGLKVISHATTKIVPKSATALYVVPSGGRGVLAGSSPQRIVTVNRAAVSGAGVAGLPAGVIKTVRAGAGPGKPSVIVLQKGAGLPAVSGGVALYRPARARMVSGGSISGPGSGGAAAANNVYLVDMAASAQHKPAAPTEAASAPPPATSPSGPGHGATNGDTGEETESDSAPDTAATSTSTSQDTEEEEDGTTAIGHGSHDAENNLVEAAEAVAMDLSRTKARPEEEQEAGIPTYDFSSGASITRVLDSEVIENNHTEAGLHTTNGQE